MVLRYMHSEKAAIVGHFQYSTAAGTAKVHKHAPPFRGLGGRNSHELDIENFGRGVISIVQWDSQFTTKQVVGVVDAEVRA